MTPSVAKVSANGKKPLAAAALPMKLVESATIVNHVDPAIIGGFILRVGDLQYDASIANKFRKLKRELSN